MELEGKSSIGKNQNVIMENRERLNITGVEEVIHFDENTVVLRTVLGELSVQGEQLKVERLQVESGELSVSGKLCALVYAQEHMGWWERLFT